MITSPLSLPRHLIALGLIAATPLLALVPMEPVQAASKDTEAQESTRDLYLTLIRQARKDGHVRAALAYLDDFDLRYPGELEANLLRANCLLDLDQVDAAAQVIDALPIKDRKGEIHALRGHLRLAQGHWDGAVAEYQTALSYRPTDPLASNALGYAQLRAGQTGLAIESFKRAGELAPDNAVVRNNLLLALTIDGRDAEVETILLGIGDEAARQRLLEQVLAEAKRLTGQIEEGLPMERTS